MDQKLRTDHIYLPEGRNKGTKGNNSRISKELANLSHTTDVLLTILRSESKVLVQASPDVVTVQSIGRNTS